ncbi:MAG: hypothetical protein ABI598_01995 [Chloroflexota bacterium]
MRLPFRQPGRGLLITALAAVLLTTGCGRRAQQTDAGTGTLASPPAQQTQLASAPPTLAPTVAPATSEPTDAATSQPARTAIPASTPVPTPDLASIEALLSGISGDLNADATADNDEGTPQ